VLQHGPPNQAKECRGLEPEFCQQRNAEELVRHDAAQEEKFARGALKTSNR